MNVVSVNTSKPREIIIGNNAKLTGIFKQPVGGELYISQSGLQDDAIINTKYHGGCDQAVYCFHQEDYQWWERELNQPLSPGQFGENLTLNGLGDIDFRIGDRLQINNIILELTSPRVPCSTFAARMGDPKFLKQFITANRSGAYARVIQEGSLSAGDSIEFIPCTSTYPSLKDIFFHRHSKAPDRELLRQALASPMSEKLKPNLEDKLKARN